MNIRIVSLQDLLRSINPEERSPKPVLIDHDTFEAYTKAYQEVFDGTRHSLDSIALVVFGNNAEDRPVKFEDKFLGMSQLNASQHILFIIEKREGRWEVTRNTFAVTEQDPHYASDEGLRSIFTRLISA